MSQVSSHPVGDVRRLQVILGLDGLVSNLLPKMFPSCTCREKERERGRGRERERRGEERREGGEEREEREWKMLRNVEVTQGADYAQ